jgi:hypothetical protein
MSMNDDTLLKYTHTYIHTHTYTHTHTHTHTYVRTCIHTYTPWIHEYVTKKTGFGTILKYINVQDFIVQNTIDILHSSIEHHLYI